MFTGKKLLSKDDTFGQNKYTVCISY